MICQYMLFESLYRQIFIFTKYTNFSLNFFAWVFTFLQHCLKVGLNCVKNGCCTSQMIALLANYLNLAILNYGKNSKKSQKLNNFQLSSRRDGLVSSVQSNHVHWLRGESQEEFGGTGEISGNLVGGDVVAALNPS